MDIILYFFRDKIVGTYYFIYAFLCLFLMFSIIGYLFKQKYAKLEVKLNTSQDNIKKEIKEKKIKESKIKIDEPVNLQQVNESVEVITEQVQNNVIEQSIPEIK